jgi:hypothetical protein
MTKTKTNDDEREHARDAELEAAQTNLLYVAFSADARPTTAQIAELLESAARFRKAARAVAKHRRSVP